MSPEALPILLFGGFFVLVLVLAYYGKKQAEARTAALAQFAAANGLQFLPGILPDRLPGGFFEQLFADRSNSDEGRLLERFAGFYPFGIGHSPQVKNLIYGPRGELDYAVFDYSYKVTTSNGKTTTTTTHPFTIVASRLPLSLPAITLQPENFITKIGGALGMRDLQFEVEEFNRRYYVKSPDERGCYDILHPQAIEYLLGVPPRHWQIAGFQILMVFPRYQEPLEIGRMMTDMEGFVRLIPGYVRQDRGFTPRWQGPY